MREPETVKWKKHDKIARVILNRPAVLNAVDNRATMDLNTVASRIAEDSDVRVVVIMGAGRSFCTGIDLRQLSTNQIDMKYFDRWERALRVFEEMDKIVVAAIKQYCLGGGLQLALACDIRIAASNAILGLPGIKEGLVPGMGTWRLPRYVGLGPRETIHSFRRGYLSEGCPRNGTGRLRYSFIAIQSTS